MLSTSQTRSTAETINQVVIDQKYIIIKNIYKGKQYNIYLEVKRQLAIKSDQLDEKNEQYYSHYSQQEEKEKFYLIKMKKQIQQNEAIPELQFITKLQESKCVPTLVNYGEQIIKGSKYHYQIMERQGPSIKLFYNYVSRNIPLQILCLIAIQTLTCLEIVHKHYIVHRNLRPKKLLLSNNGTEILLSDFKYACKFKKQNGSIMANENYKLMPNKSFLNKYSSLAQHMNQMPTPKDDLESLAYMLLVYATNSTIFDVKADSRGLKLKKWENIKLSLIPEVVFKSAPFEFIHFFNLVKTSTANDFPQEYEKFKLLFRKIILSSGSSEKDLQYPIIHMKFFDRNRQTQSQQQTLVSKFKKMQNQKMSSESIKEEEADDEASGYQQGKVGEDRTIEPLMKGLTFLSPKSITNLNSQPQFEQKIVKLRYAKK